MSLEKLTYYAQAFHLALNDEPLFGDEVQAWKWGPVVPAVYKRYQGFGANPIFSDADVPAAVVGKKISDFLSQIIGFFRQYTASTLSRATHWEEPWRDASGFAENIIRQRDMQVYYRELMSVGELALSRHELLGTIPEPRWSSFYLAGICARKMTAHPFYDSGLANKLAESVGQPKDFPPAFFDPVKDRDFVDFTRDEDPSDTIRRAIS
jgi:uncharacterized phage-associated protein